MFNDKELKDKYPDCLFISRKFNDDETLLVVDSQFKWSVEIWVYEDCYFAYNLFVKEEHRRQGLATRAIELVNDIAMKDKIDVCINIDNSDLINFYTGLGYEKDINSEEGENRYIRKFLL